MISRFTPAILAVAIVGCNSMHNEMSGIVICPAESIDYVESLIGSPIPANREQVDLAIKERNLQSEYYETSEARSPFCNKSVSAKTTLQAHFPVQEDGRVKPLLKFYFDDQGEVIAIEELTQRRPPSL